MEIHFASKGINNYIEVNVGKQLEVGGEQYNQLNMLKECDVEELIKPINYNIDNKAFLEYSITGLYILDRFFSKEKPDGVFLENIMKTLKNVTKNMERYMLNQNDLVLNLEYIMYSEKENQIKLVYIPGYNLDIREQLKTFFEKLMVIFDHNDRNGVELLYDLYHKVVEDNFSIKEMKIRKVDKVVENVASNNAASDISAGKEGLDLGFGEFYAEQGGGDALIHDSAKEKAVSKDFIRFGILGITVIALIFYFFKFFVFQGNKKDIYIIAGLIVALLIQIIIVSADDKDEDEDMAMEEYEHFRKIKEINSIKFSDVQTKCLSETTNNKDLDIETKGVKAFMPLTNGGLSKIDLLENSNEITVGRSRVEADYCLDTTQISRNHAKIIKEDGLIYIVDNKSTNGTYINSEKLENDQKAVVSVGDIVRFANEDFVAL